MSAKNFITPQYNPELGIDKCKSKGKGYYFKNILIKILKL